MIYTVTLNPAIDYVIKVDKLSADCINRAGSAELYYGGKGINVSVILTRLGIENTALGFSAGFTGEQLEKMLKADGINCSFIQLKSGNTRINVKLKAEAEYDINADGPDVSEDDTVALINALSAAKNGDMIVLSGSVPNNLPGDIYKRIMAKLENKGVIFAVDAAGDALLNTLKYRPFLIKPNHLELGELFGVEIESFADAKQYAGKLREMGARNVLVSFAEKGALLVDETGEISVIKSAEGTLVNSTGCGDSMVAGFIAGYDRYKNYSDALRLASACGSATAFSEGLAAKEEIERLFK